MVIQVAPHLRETIMSNAKNLKGQVHPEGCFKFYVFPHVPEAFRATRAKHQERIDEIQTRNEGKEHKDWTRVTGTKFFINNEVQMGLIEPPTPSKVVNRVQLYGEKIKNIPLVKTNPETRLGSTFIGYALHVKTLQLVEMAYVKLRTLHPFARHIMLAYDVAGEVGSCDDGEYFGDLALRDVIQWNRVKDIAFFMIRMASHQQIGGQRFDIIRTLAGELLVQLDNQEDK